MNIEDMKIKIDEYFDGELTSADETMIFTELSQNVELREYFKQMHLLKEGIKQTLAPLPDPLDEKILRRAGALHYRTTLFKSFLSAPQLISYAAALALLLLTLLFYSHSVSMERQFESTLARIDKQNKIIEILFNGLQETKVEDTINNQIIVKANL